MSWIKNKFNKLFSADPNEAFDEQQEFDYEETQPNNYEEQEAHNRQMRNQNEPQQKSKSFRFPLIDDEHLMEERASKAPPQQPSTNYDYHEEEAAPLKLPSYLQKQSHNVYDVEVAGIRDLLERRRKGKGHSNVIRTESDIVRKVPITKEERRELTPKPVREERKVNQEFINPLENRKRFVPTEVPSPIHGFQKPTPIEKLMNHHQPEQKIEEPAVELVAIKEHVTASQVEVIKEIIPEPVEEIVVAETTVHEEEVPELEEVELVVEAAQPKEKTGIVAEKQPILFEEVAEQVTEVVVDLTRYENIEASPILEKVVETAEPLAEVPSFTEVEFVSEVTINKQPETSISDVLNDMQVQHVTFENSTIHIGQLNVEQLPQKEEVTVAMPESEPVENELTQVVEQPEKGGSRVPFNVVMLKSDKQKLMTKKFVEQQITLDQLAAKEEQQEQPEITQEEVYPEPESQHEPQMTQQIVQHITIGSSNKIVMDTKEETETVDEKELNATEPLLIFEELEIDVKPIEVQSVAVPVVTAEDEVSATVIEDEMILEQPVQEVEQVTITERLKEGPSEPIIQFEAIQPTVVLQQKTITERSQSTMHPAIQIEPIPPLQLQAELVKEQHKQETAVTVLQQEEMIAEPERKRIPYVKPPLEYLVPPEEMIEDREWMDEQGENLVESLSYFQIQAQIESIVQGPAVTQFEITVGQGTKVSKVRNLADDIKLALAAKDIRIDAPIPGKRTIGIEIPNRISRSVRLSEVTDSDSFRNSDSPLEAALGLDLTGRPVTIDLRKMPHGLIAGATGSGKSVCINSILVSLLYKSDPNELKLMLIDPKMVELAPFNHIPHLVSPVITDVKAATAALKWAVEEMERRYQLFMHSGARKIEAYNKMCDEKGMYAQKLPYLLIVIDELADLMMMSPQDVEDSICRITQKARAAGIHLIVATQRPSVDVITGLIKANIPTRIAFSVSSQIDSRTILDSQGAERLLGRGDMLYLGNGMSAPTRIQGTFVTDDEIEEIIEFVREQGEPDYLFKQEELLKRAEAVEEQDELFEEVCRFVYEQGSASTSLLQRRYHIGYNRAARLIDMLEKQGYVSEPKGSKPRDVFITEEELTVQFGD